MQENLQTEKAAEEITKRWFNYDFKSSRLTANKVVHKIIRLNAPWAQITGAKMLWHNSNTLTENQHHFFIKFDLEVHNQILRKPQKEFSNVHVNLIYKTLQVLYISWRYFSHLSHLQFLDGDFLFFYVLSGRLKPFR